MRFLFWLVTPAVNLDSGADAHRQGYRMEEEMVKELKFDLEFKKDGIVALTEAGVTFLSLYRDDQDLSHAYRTAIGYGLHVRFETADIRDRVARVPIS